MSLLLCSGQNVAYDVKNSTLTFSKHTDCRILHVSTLCIFWARVDALLKISSHLAHSNTGFVIFFLTVNVLVALSSEHHLSDRFANVP